MDGMDPRCYRKSWGNGWLKNLNQGQIYGQVSCVNPFSFMGLEAALLKSQCPTAVEKLIDRWVAFALCPHLLVINHENQGPLYLVKAESLAISTRRWLNHKTVWKGAIMLHKTRSDFHSDKCSSQWSHSFGGLQKQSVPDLFENALHFFPPRRQKSAALVQSERRQECKGSVVTFGL